MADPAISRQVSATLALNVGDTVDIVAWYTTNAYSPTYIPTFVTTAGSNYLAIKRTGSAPLVTSDIRLKKNILSFTGGLDDILGLNTVSFEYNGGTKNAIDDGTVHVGVIAQEVQS